MGHHLTFRTRMRTRRRDREGKHECPLDLRPRTLSNNQRGPGTVREAGLVHERQQRANNNHQRTEGRTFLPYTQPMQVQSPTFRRVLRARSNPRPARCGPNPPSKNFTEMNLTYAQDQNSQQEFLPSNIKSYCLHSQTVTYTC